MRPAGDERVAVDRAARAGSQRLAVLRGTPTVVDSMVGSMGFDPVAPRELVVVASWTPQKAQGGAVFVSIDGRAIAELFNKRRPFRITLAPGSSIISFRVMTTGVLRKHRKAVLDVDVELGADEGGLALVSCAHGYLWPLVRSKPAELRWRTGSDLHVPHPRLWRVGFSGDKPSDTDRVIIA